MFLIGNNLFHRNSIFSGGLGHQSCARKYNEVVKAQEHMHDTTEEDEDDETEESHCS